MDWNASEIKARICALNAAVGRTLETESPPGMLSTAFEFRDTTPAMALQLRRQVVATPAKCQMHAPRHRVLHVGHPVRDGDLVEIDLAEMRFDFIREMTQLLKVLDRA